MNFLERIRLPTLLLNAEDDPFLPREVLDNVRVVAAKNPFLNCIFPAHGGHAGFVAGRWPWKPKYWMEEFAIEWMVETIRNSKDINSTL